MLKKLSVNMYDVWTIFQSLRERLHTEHRICIMIKGILEASALLKSKMTDGTCSIITAVPKKKELITLIWQGHLQNESLWACCTFLCKKDYKPE